MATNPRLNTVIRALELDETAVAAFVSPPTVENAIAFSTAPYDGVVFEAEHNPYDIKDLRDCLQYMLNRRQIVERATLSPAVTPLIRVPANGGEMSQWLAKQVLDIGAYGEGLSLPATGVRAALRARRAARRLARACGALLGTRTAGILRESRRLASEPARGDPGRHHVRGRPGHR
jgi:2-keto-3-deoxy-L-rhamnonate aldolase RhmA